MKKLRHYITTIAIACFVTACSSDSYPGLEYEYDTTSTSNTEEGTVEDLGVQVKVFISEQGFYTASALNETKGTGPFVVPDTTVADHNHYEKSIFRLFAFRNRRDEQGPYSEHPDYTKRSNVDKVDCLIDGPIFEYGMPAHLGSDHAGELLIKAKETQMIRPDLMNDTVIYYNSRFEDYGYRFFAYYLDDAIITNARRESSRIHYDIEIDGTQDIMVGQSQKLTSEVLNKRHNTVSLTSEQRNRINWIGCYGSYSSSLGIYPIVDLKHMLARIQFLAYPADESCSLVYIDSVSINSKYRGEITVAAHNSAEIGMTFKKDRKWFHLMQRPNPKGLNSDSLGIYPLVDLNSNENHLEWDNTMSKTDWRQNKHIILGSDMLVPKDSVYSITLHYHQKVKENEINIPEDRKFKFETTLSAPHIDANYDEATNSWCFMPGKIYYVPIRIYGLKKIDVDVDLNMWEDDGNVNIDNDAP